MYVYIYIYIHRYLHVRANIVVWTGSQASARAERSGTLVGNWGVQSLRLHDLPWGPWPLPGLQNKDESNLGVHKKGLLETSLWLKSPNKGFRALCSVGMGSELGHSGFVRTSCVYCSMLR